MTAGGEDKACPFCAAGNARAANVCRCCGRDIAIPEHLRAEHAELIETRDRLRRELEAAKAKLASPRPSTTSR